MDKLSQTAEKIDETLSGNLEKKNFEAAVSVSDPLQQKKDEKYMRAALKQAQKALALGEVPIGAVIVFEDKIIARGYNRRNTEHTTLAHAEMAAIRKANRKLGDWRLEGCTLYCTLEPCQMCAGALVQSRIDRVVIGAPSSKSGSLGTVVNILHNEAFNHQVSVTFGVLQEECSEIIRKFFKELRYRNKMLRKAQQEEGKFELTSYCH